MGQRSISNLLPFHTAIARELEGIKDIIQKGLNLLELYKQANLIIEELLRLTPANVMSQTTIDAARVLLHDNQTRTEFLFPYKID
jgi:hypothetical protein